MGGGEGMDDNLSFVVLLNWIDCVRNECNYFLCCRCFLNPALYKTIINKMSWLMAILCVLKVEKVSKSIA